MQFRSVQRERSGEPPRQLTLATWAPLGATAKVQRTSVALLLATWLQHDPSMDAKTVQVARVRTWVCDQPPATEKDTCHTDVSGTYRKTKLLLGQKDNENPLSIQQVSAEKHSVRVSCPENLQRERMRLHFVAIVRILHPRSVQAMW